MEKNLTRLSEVVYSWFTVLFTITFPFGKLSTSIVFISLVSSHKAWLMIPPSEDLRDGLLVSPNDLYGLAFFPRIIFTAKPSF